MGIDIIGDVHGELPALQALGRRLGYTPDWSHPQGRTLLFLGDLVDRGQHSLEVARLVMGLASRGQARCIMGNHEYNLVAWWLNVPGYERPKSSNRATIEAIKADRDAWLPVLHYFRDLPIGIDMPDLRVIHACWHLRSLRVVESVLTPAVPQDHVVLRSPFEQSGMRTGLPQDLSDLDEDLPHEHLLKGFEVPADKPFVDNDGHMRDRIRATWWKDDHHDVLHDKTQVFGHYWNLPPIEGDFAPPYPSGHPELRAWAQRLVGKCPDEGTVPLVGDFACVDFNGFTKAAGDRACVGALRWPEREVVWAVASR